MELMDTASSGLFITLEGGEGCGKSTQASLLGEALTNLNMKVVVTREPGGAPGAEIIRKLLVEGELDRWDGLTETLLHTAARRNHLVNTVWPAMSLGTVVICDRFFDSTLAYQGYGHGIDLDKIRAIHSASIGNFAPALTFIFDMPVETAFQRINSRAGTELRYENMNLEFHERVRQGFLDTASSKPNRYKVINASREASAIHLDVLSIVLGILKNQERGYE